MIEIIDELLLDDIEAGYMEELSQQRAEIIQEKPALKPCMKSLWLTWPLKIPKII